jgi:hypothetical protein
MPMPPCDALGYWEFMVDVQSLRWGNLGGQAHVRMPGTWIPASRMLAAAGFPAGNKLAQLVFTGFHNIIYP